MILGTTTDKLQIITSTTAPIDVHASFADMDDTTKEVTVDRQNTKIVTATTTDVLAAPASGKSRKLKIMNVANIDAAAANDVTIQYNENGTAIQIEKVTLLAGERISWRENTPMRVIDAAGLEKMAETIVPGTLISKVQPTDVTNSTTTAAKITGLDTQLGAGTWVFEYWLRFRSATATVGPKLSVNHSGTVTVFDYEIHSVQVNTADSLGALDQDATALQVMGAFAARAKSATAPLIGTVGVDTINLDVMLTVTGLCVVTVLGNLELYHASETATATSIMAGSALRCTKVG